jgi:hypothetical protein
VLNTVDALILDLLEWIGPRRSRPYSEVIEAWRTSCPRLPVWEEANERGFVERHQEPGLEVLISVTALGKEVPAQESSATIAPALRFSTDMMHSPSGHGHRSTGSLSSSPGQLWEWCVTGPAVRTRLIRPTAGSSGAPNGCAIGFPRRFAHRRPLNRVVGRSRSNALC